MKPSIGLWFRRALSLPAVLFGYAAVAFAYACWGERIWWEEGILFTRLKPTSWLGRTWGARWAGVTLGHGVVLGQHASAITVVHELVHVEQIEVNSVVGLVLSLMLIPWWGVWAFQIWSMLPVAIYLAGFLVAWLRGEEPYHGNVAEEAAYDRTADR